MELYLFIGLNAVNVIVQTIKSLATVKCSKAWLIALINALGYGYYALVNILLITSTLTNLEKCLVIACCNLVCVYVVIKVEHKTKKERLWKIESTCITRDLETVQKNLKDLNLSFGVTELINTDKYKVINVYCENKKETKKAMKTLGYYNCKSFVSASCV